MRFNPITLEVPVKQSFKLFTGESRKLNIHDGRIILPGNIVDVIQSIQKSLPEEEKGLIYITDFYSEHRCIPHNELLSKISHENEYYCIFP